MFITSEFISVYDNTQMWV